MMMSTILLFLECTQKSGSTDFASNPRRRNLQIHFVKNVLQFSFEWLHGGEKPMIKMIEVCASLPALFSQKYHF